MSDIKVSLFASAVRPALWPAIFKSLKGTSVSYEIVFSGHNTPEELHKTFTDNGIGLIHQAHGVTRIEHLHFIYIHTGQIKPSQNYEISRRNCSGETVIWTADDAEYNDDVVGKSYKYWKSQDNEKLILSIQTKESGYGLPQGQLFDMNMHRFFGYRTNTPLMAPLALMSRKFLDDLGGYDRRYVAGQTENDVVMRAYNEGAKVEIFGGKDCYIEIDHLAKSLAIGESKNEADFLNRPFAKGYNKDREVLESSWTKNGKLYIENDKYVRFDNHEPFSDQDILTKSQSNKGIWE